MRLSASDPDVQTLVTRIKDKVLDLQPDFQRQEVWSEAKKRRLIDSILREWHVPPVHVVVDEDGKENVLDGQQRLAAIRDFVDGKFGVDGFAEPLDAEIERLNGKKFHELPKEILRKFNRFTIRYYRIEDYKPEEPGELFYRLNQPTNLTTAEQRNAFYGPARRSIKELVDHLESRGLNGPALGFSNARMAYDDVIARICFSLDVGTLNRKVTAQDITDVYRKREGFKEIAIVRAKSAIDGLASARHATNMQVKFNKATLYSWLCFLAAYHHPPATSLNDAAIGEFIEMFERKRKQAVPGQDIVNLYAVFNDRASSRSADTASVLSRDFILWYELVAFCRTHDAKLSQRNPRIARMMNVKCPNEPRSLEGMGLWVTETAARLDWGGLL